MNLRSHRLIAWLLPLLVVRAFVPTGFMWSAAEGELSLAFCRSAGPAVQLAASANDSPVRALDHAHAASHHHDAHAQHGSQSSTGHSSHFGASDTGVCPFAVVTVACSACNVFAGTVRFDADSELVPSYTSPSAANRPIRADRIRGPPIALSHG